MPFGYPLSFRMPEFDLMTISNRYGFALQLGQERKRVIFFFVELMNELMTTVFVEQPLASPGSATDNIFFLALVNMVSSK